MVTTPIEARELVGAEEATSPFAQLPLVELEAAAHRAYVTRVRSELTKFWKYGVPYLAVISKRSFALGESQFEVLGDVVGGYGVLEAASLGVALEHEPDEDAVEQVHLRLAVAVGEGHLLAADHGGTCREIGRAGPVQGDVREGEPGCTPAAWRVDAEEEGLDALPDLRLVQRSLS